MDLFFSKTIKQLCKKYNIYPAKTKGQNFLISQKMVDKVIRAADLKKDDVVLEIGPGLGVITQELAKKVKKVLAVEIDKKLVKALEEILVDYKNVEIIYGDILKIRSQASTSLLKPGFNRQRLTPYKLVANLPFNITGLVLKKFLSYADSVSRPSLMVLILQKEVAEKIAAKPGKMSLLAVSVQFYGNPKIVARVPRSNFWPQPDVDSAIIKIKTTEAREARLPKIKTTEARLPKEAELQKLQKFEKDFFRLVRAGFSSPRKKLVNNLLNQYFEVKTRGRASKDRLVKIFQKLHLNPNIRAQELSVEDWIKLTKLIR